MILCNKGIYGKRSQVRLLVSHRHVLWVDVYIRHFSWGKEKYIGTFQRSENQNIQRFTKGLQSLAFMRIVGVESTEMVGERSRKELVGEVEKWKQRGKVWKKLEKGDIANYITKLHGFDLDVTNSMVNSWKDGKVKVNGVSF